MRRNTQFALASMLCLAPAAVAWRTAGDPLTLEPQSRIWVDGKSTVRKFSCKAPVFTVDVDASAGAVSAVLSANKAVRSASVRIPVEKMDCGNGTMNEHMMKALKGKENPTITFRITSYEVAKAGDGVDGKAIGELTLGGVTKTITVSAHATPQAGGTLRLVGSQEIRMTEFGLKPPTLMLGTLKVNELVKVSFDLLLKGDARSAA